MKGWGVFVLCLWVASSSGQIFSEVGSLFNPAKDQEKVNLKLLHPKSFYFASFVLKIVC